MIALVVIVPFDKYASGDRIVSPAEVKKVLETHRKHVVQIEETYVKPVSAEGAVAEGKNNKKKDVK